MIPKETKCKYCGRPVLFVPGPRGLLCVEASLTPYRFRRAGKYWQPSGAAGAECALTECPGHLWDRAGYPGSSHHSFPDTEKNTDSNHHRR